MSATYLRRAPRGWTFRRAIPQHLRDRFQRTEVVRSLARISQAEASARARAWGVACEALFMRVESEPHLTTTEIDRLIHLYIENQQALFETRLEALRRGHRPLHQALRQERDVYAEMAKETAAALRDRVSLFGDDAISDLAEKAGVEPGRAIENGLLGDALTLALTRHQRDCAARLTPPQRPNLFRQLFGPSQSADTRVASRASIGAAAPAKANAYASERPNHRDEAADERGPRPAPSHVSTRLAPGHAHAAARFDASASLRAWTATASMAPSANAARVPQQRLNQDALSTLDDVVPAGETPVSTTETTRVAMPFESITASGPDHVEQIDQAAGQTNDLEPPCDGKFSTVWSDFVESQITTGQYSITRRPELKSTSNIVTWLAGGDFQLGDATAGFLSEIRRRYLTLPVDYKNLRIAHEDGKRWRTYDELMEHVAIQRTQGASFKTVHPKSWNKHKGSLRVCVDWAKANRTSLMSLENAFAGLHIKVKKSARAAKLERAMTPTNALVALFRTPVWTGRHSHYHLCRPGHLIVRDSLYWVPIIEAGNGLRREEVCQLRVRHIIRRHGLWCINFLAADLRVKTCEASPRLVLIHREVLDAGFIEALVLGRDPDELLFVELNNDNAHCAYGLSYGKRIANYVDRMNFDLGFLDAELREAIPADARRQDEILQEMKEALTAEFRAKFSNHGIRHWWKTTAISADCNPAHVDDQLGHVGEIRGEGHRYLKEVDVRALKATVDKVPMPFVGAELKKLFDAMAASSGLPSKGR